ncbi:unnamed protein product, partial [Ectocarpus sp. 12 AP-2014]
APTHRRAQPRRGAAEVYRETWRPTAFHLMQWPCSNKKTKGSGKARGQHNPGGEENTFKTVLNDDSDRNRRKKGKGEQKSSSQQPSSSSSRSAT